MRRLVVASLVLVVLAAASSAYARPLLGVTGNPAHFQAQTAQRSLVVQAFLGWGQGQTYGSPFRTLFETLGPIPMIHLGTSAAGNGRQALTVEQIAAGRGDGYLQALNRAIAAWGRAIYIRPLGEMNNRGNPWSGNPGVYRKAFARIFLIVHGGEAVTAGLSALRLPAYKGPALAANAFPRVRLVWSPLATGSDAELYWPGNAYTDVAGVDIYREPGSGAPWAKVEKLFSFAKAHHKPFAVPEWGLIGLDDPAFVAHMCGFLKSHPTEVAEFFNGRPGSVLDLVSKPRSRAVYRMCVTPLGASAPVWAR